MIVGVAAISGLLLAHPASGQEPEYSGTVVAYCQINGEPVIEAENTGTGDLTLDVAGTGFPLNVDAPIITVQWPSDASGPLPQAAWRLLIPGTETVIDSGTLTLPDCTPTTDPPVTDPPVTDPPATDPPATDPPATHPSVSSLPKTGSANWWIAAMAGGFVLVGSALYVVGRRPN